MAVCGGVLTRHQHLNVIIDWFTRMYPFSQISYWIGRSGTTRGIPGAVSTPVSTPMEPITS